MPTPKFELDSLSGDSEDTYLQTKLQTYLKRPTQLDALTYPEFCQWWRSATQDEQKKAAWATSQHVIKCKGANDFQSYLDASSAMETVREHLADVLSECDLHIQNSDDLLTLKRCLKSHNISLKVIEAVVKYYIDLGIDELNEISDVVPLASLALTVSLVESIDFDDPKIVDGLNSYHWLMGSNSRDELVSVLSTYTPGTVLADRVGHYWIRRAKMVITRHRFISSVGDDTEKYYQ